MTLELSVELEEIKRLSRAGFMPQARVRIMALQAQPGWMTPPNAGIHAELSMLALDSKAGLFGRPEESEIEEALRRFDGSGEFGSSLHALALYRYSHEGLTAEARLRLLDAVLAESDIVTEDDRMKCVRFRRRLDLGLPSDAAWRESIRAGTVEFDGHATFADWERRVLAGEHKPTSHWIGAADEVISFMIFSYMKKIGVTEELNWALPPHGRTVVAEYSRRQAALADAYLGACPRADVTRASACFDDATKCLAWLAECAPRWERWFGMDSVQYSALVVGVVRQLRLQAVVHDKGPDLPADAIAMYKKALAICSGAAADKDPDAVGVLGYTAQWQQEIQQSVAAREVALRASRPDAEDGLEPWDPEKFWAAVQGPRFPSVDFSDHRRVGLLVRGLESIVSRGEWEHLRTWHQRASRVDFTSLAEDARKVQRLRELALKCFEGGRFGSGLGLLSLSQPQDHLRSAPEDATQDKAHSYNDELDSLLHRMREALGRAGSVESVDEFADAMQNFNVTRFAGAGLDRIVFQLGVEALDRTAAIAPTDHARLSRRLFDSVAAAEWGGRLHALRETLATAIDTDPAAALEALRFERFVESRWRSDQSLACDTAYRARLIERLRAMPSHRLEILDGLGVTVGPAKSDAAWIDLLTQLMQWQSDAGVPLWGQMAPAAVSAGTPGCGLLDLTRESSEDDRGIEQSVAEVLFKALLESQSGGESREQGWQAVPEHGGSWIPPEPARALFEEFLRTVSPVTHGSLWTSVVFHHELPVEYRIEALRAWLDRAEAPAADGSKSVTRPIGWSPAADLGDVLLRDLLECGHVAEARERSKGLLGDQHQADTSPRSPSALFAVMAARESEDQRLAWLRWYSDHWRAWMPDFASQAKALLAASEEGGQQSQAAAWRVAAHGLAFVGFELLRRARRGSPPSPSMHFEGLDCIVRADLAFQLKAACDDSSAWTPMRYTRKGPSGEIAAWSMFAGDDPHRVSRLVFRGLIKELAPGTLEWGCAIGLALRFACWHKDRELQTELLALLQSRESEIDALMQRDHDQKLVRQEQEFKKRCSERRFARGDSVDADADERAWQARRDQIKPPPSLRSEIERWRASLS